MDFKRSSVHLARRTEVSTTSMSPCQNDLGTADFATHHCSSRAVALSSPAFSGVKLWQDIKTEKHFWKANLKRLKAFGSSFAISSGSYARGITS